MSIAAFPLVFLLPETYPPIILERRAKKLRDEGKPNARAMSEIHSKTPMQVVQGHVLRPLGEKFVFIENELVLIVYLAMIVREPITQGAALWVSLAYGII